MLTRSEVKLRHKPSYMEPDLKTHLQKRGADIQQLIEAIRSGWPFLLAELKSREQEKTQQLVTANDETLRGRIKEIRDLQELPSDLYQELEDIGAALSEMDAAE